MTLIHIDTALKVFEVVARSVDKALKDDIMPDKAWFEDMVRRQERIRLLEDELKWQEARLQK